MKFARASNHQNYLEVSGSLKQIVNQEVFKQSKCEEYKEFEVDLGQFVVQKMW